MSTNLATVIPVKPAKHCPHTAAARVIPSGVMSDVFSLAGTGQQTAADRTFKVFQGMAREQADRVRANNAALNVAHERYRDIEADVVSQYAKKGLDVADMSVGTLRGVVNLHSQVTSIHEVGAKARADIQDIGQKANDDFGAKMDRLIARLG